MKKGKSKKIYLDHASTTPMLPEVVSAMRPYFEKDFYNPSGLYAEGVKVQNDLNYVRKTVANVLHALPDEIVFTGSGTESDNMAILGVVKAAMQDGIKTPHVIISAIEHPAIMELQSEIKNLGGRVTVVPVLHNGIVEVEALRKALKENTVLVSIMYTNNEIGTVQPIKEIIKAVRFFRKSKKKNTDLPYVHTDACQAANYLDLNVQSLNVDLMSLDGSKIYGPKGVGVLFKKRTVRIAPIVFGGGQEHGLRSGTQNVAGIIGFGKALLIVQKDSEKESRRLLKIRDKTLAVMKKLVPDLMVHCESTGRLPNIINVCVPHMDGEYAVIMFDAAGFAVSSASSCQNLHENSHSYVIEALNNDDCAGSSLRVSMGRSTTDANMKAFLKVFPAIIARARQD